MKKEEAMTQIEEVNHTPWHALSEEEVRKKTGTSGKGLSAEEYGKQRETYGPNRLPEGQRKPAWKRFLLHFHNVLIYVLIGAAVVTLLLQEWIDAAVIGAVVIINAIIGYLQEGKAEKALDAIRGMLSLQAVVFRDGKKQEISAEDLVPGDWVYLQSGDKVPADVRLLKVRSLRVEEAALTGESVPVEKSTGSVGEDASLGDRSCMAYSGTLVSYGQAEGIVVATGSQTELGKINALMKAAPELTTPLLLQIADFGKKLTYVIIGLSLVTFLFGYFLRSYDFDEMFLAVVGLAVAAIPEGLPAILTITLAIGVQAMARRKAIIRRLPAVETLGSVSVICSDKTGTLTRNEMTVTSVVTSEGLVQISGTGYNPQGSFSRDIDEIDPSEDQTLHELVLAGLLCNDSQLKEEDNLWRVEGDPTEGALLALAGKAGLDRTETDNGYPRISSVPFESEHKYMATLHSVPDQEETVVYLKGAPERILQRCQEERNDDCNTPLKEENWEKAIHHLASRGQRVLGLASKKFPADQKDISHEDLDGGFTFLGFAGLIDPPRDEARESIKDCHTAGIEVKMITGDHALTAEAIGKELGLSSTDKVVTGDQIEKVSDAELEELVGQSDIFARTSPEHKLRLVKALQARNRIVAMTGDGVNDAPALKTANVGVSMGIKGTEAAKEASEMVLVDDNFASIANAVEEGRTVYDNIRKSILFILPTNGAQALIIISAIVAGLTLPLTPVQILWVNMITAVTLALALAFEPAEKSVMKRPPRNHREPLLPMFFLWRIGFVSVIILIGSLGMFLWSQGENHSLELSRTLTVNTLIAGQIFYLLNSRFILESSWRKGLVTGNPYVLYAIAVIVLAQILFTYMPVFHIWFGTHSTPWYVWLPIFVIGVLVFVLVELEKWVIRKFFRG